jgi:rhamnosyltransferase
MATRNGSQHVLQQLRSILEQRHVHVRIVASDDASDDGTLEMLQEVAQEESRVQIVPPCRCGSAADNFLRLLRETPVQEGEYVALSDQDDIWMPTRLDRALKKMAELHTDGYSSDLLAFDESTGSKWQIRKSFRMRRLDYLFGGASAGCTYVLTARAVGILKAAINQEPAKGWSHDWLFYAICRSAGLSWHFDPEPTVLYRQHAANAYGARSGVRGVLVRCRAIRDGWYRGRVIDNGRFLQGDPQEQAVLNRMDRWFLRDRLWLACHGLLFRRRLRDGAILAVAALFMPREVRENGVKGD